MNCPNCGDTKTPVTDVAAFAKGSKVIRERKCQNCEAKFKTIEKCYGKIHFDTKVEGKK